MAFVDGSPPSAWLQLGRRVSLVQPSNLIFVAAGAVRPDATEGRDRGQRGVGQPRKVTWVQVAAQGGGHGQRGVGWPGGDWRGGGRGRQVVGTSGRPGDVTGASFFERSPPAMAVAAFEIENRGRTKKSRDVLGDVWATRLDVEAEP